MDGSSGLASGFVLAALVAAVIFVDRIGGADELVRRLFQVSLAVTLAFAVIAGTATAIRPPKAPPSFSASSSSSSSSSSTDSQQTQFFKDVANRSAAVTSIHFGFGLAALLAGVVLLRRRATIALALALGGLLLVLFGGVSSSPNTSSTDPFSAIFSVYFSALGGVIGRGSLLADGARFGVFGAGTLVLIFFGLWKWDTGISDPSTVAIAAQTRTPV